MIFQKGFRIPVEENLFSKAIQILTEEFGLVNGVLEPMEGNYRVLVWEDETGVGRYRVHCQGNHEVKGEKYSEFVFHYWANERLNRNILEKDPMKPALERILSEAKNPIDMPHIYVEREIDEVLKE